MGIAKDNGRPDRLFGEGVDAAIHSNAGDISREGAEKLLWAYFDALEEKRQILSEGSKKPYE